MYCVAVKDHFMIAHSFKGEVFGPAQGMHGATYNVSLELRSPSLDENGIVFDIGEATRVLGAALDPLRFANLDEEAAFAGKNTTTEFLAAHIHAAVSSKLRNHFAGTARVVLEESHVAWASFEGPVHS